MRIEQVGDVALLRLEAGRANAIGLKFLSALEGLIDRLGGARAVVFTGQGSAFSAGIDLPALVELDRAAMRGYMERFGEVMLRVFQLPMPVVAAVNGHAIAGGCVLALQADLRLAADREARIGLNETQLGIGLPAVVLETLRGQVAPQSLLPIALEGRLFTPEEATSLGLLHELVPPDRLEQRATERALELGALPLDAFAAVKRAIRAPIAQRARDLMTQDAAHWAGTWSSEEGRARRRQAIERLSRKK